MLLIPTRYLFYINIYSNVRTAHTEDTHNRDFLTCFSILFILPSIAKALDCAKKWPRAQPV